MERVMVIGCPGSGKSTFSRKLNEKTGIPLVHLDMLFWNGDKTTVDEETFLKRLTSEIQKPKWIIDGNFSSTMELRLKPCDTVFYLDYPVEVCLAGIERRKGKAREDIPWIEEEIDPEFVDFIKGFNENRRPNIFKLLEKYDDKKIYVFSNREQAEQFLESLK